MPSEEKIYTNCESYDTSLCPCLGNDAFKIPKQLLKNIPISDLFTSESYKVAKKLCAECQSFKKPRF